MSDYEKYRELSVYYLQTKQRLSALADYRRIEQIRLEKYYQKTQDENIVTQIRAIEQERQERIDVVQKDLNNLIKAMATSDYQTRHFLKTPMQQALFAHNLK
jgi:predicted ribonuclease YlaK